MRQDAQIPGVGRVLRAPASRFVWLASLALALPACGALRPAGEASPQRPLLAPATLGGERAAAQIVRGAFGEREATLQCSVVVRDDLITVVGLTALGVRLFTVRYDGREIQHERALPAPAQLTPQRLLADLQLMLWPLSALREPLAAAGWQIAEPFAGTRRLRRAGRIVAEVHYSGADPWRGRSWLANFEHGYTLAIDSSVP